MKHLGRRRPSFLKACEWIAANDEPLDMDEGEIAAYISTLLVADMWGETPKMVAGVIVRLRRMHVEHGSAVTQHLQ